jgi:hypothetical protein
LILCERSPENRKGKEEERTRQRHAVWRRSGVTARLWVQEIVLTAGAARRRPSTLCLVCPPFVRVLNRKLPFCIYAAAGTIQLDFRTVAGQERNPGRLAMPETNEQKYRFFAVLTKHRMSYDDDVIRLTRTRGIVVGYWIQVLASPSLAGFGTISQGFR